MIDNSQVVSDDSFRLELRLRRVPNVRVGTVLAQRHRGRAGLVEPSYRHEILKDAEGHPLFRPRLAVLYRNGQVVAESRDESESVQ